MSVAGIVTQLGTIEDIVTRGLIAGEAIKEVVEQYSGGYFFDFPDRPPFRPQFRAVGKKEKKAKPILEDIASRIEPDADNRDLEIILRMRLRLQGIEYKRLYQTWLERQRNELKQEVKKTVKKRRKKRDEEVILLLTLLNH